MTRVREERTGWAAFGVASPKLAHSPRGLPRRETGGGAMRPSTTCDSIFERVKTGLAIGHQAREIRLQCGALRHLLERRLRVCPESHELLLDLARGGRGSSVLGVDSAGIRQVVLQRAADCGFIEGCPAGKV